MHLLGSQVHQDGRNEVLDGFIDSINGAIAVRNRNTSRHNAALGSIGSYSWDDTALQSNQQHTPPKNCYTHRKNFFESKFLWQ